MAAKALYAIFCLLLIDFIYAQDNSCPEVDRFKECKPANEIVNECLIESDCESGSKCCSDGCELKCVPFNTTVSVCTVPVDLGFVIDASGSIGVDNFQKILEFVAKIVDAFEISEAGTHVGVIYYSDSATVAFDFTKFKGDALTKEAVINEINKISVTEGKTRIDLALKMAKESLFSESGGSRFDKPKIALVMTDGRQTTGADAPDAVDLHIASRPLKDFGVQVYSLGIGKNYDIGELLDIASDDASVFRSSDVDELVSIVASITEQTCKGCTNPVDVHFAIDSSVNVGAENFENIKNFVKAVGYKFIISESGAHMSASVFGDEATLVFNMSKATSQEAFLAKVDEIPYLGEGSGNMDQALILTNEQVFTLEGYSRQNVPKILVLLTASTCDSCLKTLEEAVKPLKELGTHIITIPLGSRTSDSEMQEIASQPFSKFIIPQPSFPELLNGLFIQQVSQMICSGKPGICVQPEIPESCEKIQYNCEVDVDCPSGRKCCQSSCIQTCTSPVAACISPIDLAFAFETTDDAQFDTMKNYAAGLLDHFKIKSSGTHVSLATYSDKPGSLQKFSASYDPATVRNNLFALKSNGGSVNNVASMLTYAKKWIFTVDNGARQSQPRVLVLFTYGQLDDAAKAEEAADLLKAAGEDVQIIVVNGGQVQEGYANIVSKPSGSKLVNIGTAEALNSDEIKQQISEEICSTKTRKRECRDKTPSSKSCSVRDNLCESDFDCPGLEECVSDGCRRRCEYCGKKCDDKLDLLLILDDSSKLGQAEFEKQKALAKTMMEWFIISQGGTNVAVMTYSDRAIIHMPLPRPGSSTPRQTMFDIQGEIEAIPYSGGSVRRLDMALALAASQVFPERGPKRNVKKAVVVFSDGNDDSVDRLDIASWPLRKQTVNVEGKDMSAIRIMAVSTGNEVNLARLEDVVTPAVEDNVFMGADFNDMYNGLRAIAKDSCEYVAG